MAAPEKSCQTAFKYPVWRVFVRHHWALELVSGAGFSFKLMCGAGPGDLGGSWGSASAEDPRKTEPKISNQAAFKCPGSCAFKTSSSQTLLGDPIIQSLVS